MDTLSRYFKHSRAIFVDGGSVDDSLSIFTDWANRSNHNRYRESYHKRILCINVRKLYVLLYMATPMHWQRLNALCQNSYSVNTSRIFSPHIPCVCCCDHKSLSLCNRTIFSLRNEDDEEVYLPNFNHSKLPREGRISAARNFALKVMYRFIRYFDWAV